MHCIQTKVIPIANNGKPYVVDSGKVRSLHFNAEEIQSAMWLARPDALYLEYTRLMMGFLLVDPQPKAIAMIGLGGGSLAKFCYRYLPLTRLLAVEHDADVLALRAAFCVPDDDERWQVRHDDGAQFLAQCEPAAFDVLLLDGYSGEGLPMGLGTQTFYDDCARVVAADGLVVANLHEAQADFLLHTARIQRSFGATLEVREGERGNCIVFAGGLKLAQARRQWNVRRPLDLEREAWVQLKPAFGRIVAAARS